MADRLPLAGETWEHRRTGRQVEIVSAAGPRSTARRVTVRGQRTSQILLTAFLRDYRLIGASNG